MIFKKRQLAFVHLNAVSLDCLLITRDIQSLSLCSFEFKDPSSFSPFLSWSVMTAVWHARPFWHVGGTEIEMSLELLFFVVDWSIAVLGHYKEYTVQENVEKIAQARWFSPKIIRYIFNSLLQSLKLGFYFCRCS